MLVEVGRIHSPSFEIDRRAYDAARLAAIDPEREKRRGLTRPPPRWKAHGHGVWSWLWRRLM